MAENNKRLEAAKRDIELKAQLEGKVNSELEVRKQLLDAEVNAYTNQLKIIQDLIDGTKEEDTVRRAALQARWDEYHLQAKTAANQKRNLEELNKLQDELKRKVESMYEAALVTIDKSAFEQELSTLMAIRKNAETIIGKERLQEELKIDKEIVDHRIAYAKEGLDKELDNLQKRMDVAIGEELAELAKMEEAINKAYNIRLAEEVKKAYSETLNEISGPNAIERVQAMADAQLKVLEDLKEKQMELVGLVVTPDGVERDLAEVERLEKEFAGRRIELETATTEKIRQLNYEMWQKNLAIAQEYINQAGQLANSISTLWTNILDHQTDQKLRDNDAMIQSDEDRAREEKKIMIEAARDRYKADLFAWSANVTMATAQAAMAVLNALSNPPGPPATIPMSILAGVLGAVQIAAVASAMPKPPRFHTGGEVMGRGEVPIIAKAGEKVLTNKQFQNTMQAIANLANARTGTGGGATMIQPIINNTVSDQVQVNARFNGERLIWDIVSKGLANGTLDQALAMQSANSRGVAITN